MLNNLKLQESNLSVRSILMISIIVYMFMLSVRMVWAHYDYNDPNFIDNGFYLINSTDGFRFAAQTKEILAGFSTPQDGSPGFRPVALLAAYLSKIGIPKEWLFFYLPPVLGSLSAIAVFLSGAALRLPIVGVAAAIFVSVSAGFFIRTSPGYFDDDMLSMTLPIFITASMLWALNSKNKISLPIIFLLGVTAKFWYPQSSLVLGALSVGAILWVLKYDRYEPMGYIAPLSLLISILPVGFAIKLGLFVATAVFFLAFAKDKKYIYRVLWLLGLAAIVYLISKFGLGEVARQWNNYVFKSEVISVGNLKYYSAFKTIAEAKALSPSQMVENMTASQIVFWLSLVGLAMLFILKRVSTVMIPLLLLGFLAMDGGNRFTPYAIPVLGLGLGFLGVLLSSYLFERIAEFGFTQRLLALKIDKIVPIVLVLAATVPSAYLLAGYKPKPDLQKPEIEALRVFDSVAKQGDYLMSWWDYGSPIRYFTKALPHSDSSYNEGHATFIEAKALTAISAAQSANLLADAAVTRQAQLLGAPSAPSTLEGILNAKGAKYKNVNELLAAMSEDGYQRNAQKFDTYLFLPYRQLSVFGAINHFAEVDPVSGKRLYSSFFRFFQHFSEDDSAITFAPDVYIDKKNGLFYLGQNSMPLKSATIVKMDENGRSTVQESKLRDDGIARVIFLQDAKAFIVCDERSFLSSYIQMYLFDNYDTKYFEPIVSSQLVKIYKVKR